MSDAPVTFTRTEIESFLPCGWSLPAEGAEGRWDAEERAWTIRVLDGVDFEWPVTVRGSEARELGRLEALRQAFDRVFRHRLGKPTRGLGLGRIA